MRTLTNLLIALSTGVCLLLPQVARAEDGGHEGSEPRPRSGWMKRLPAETRTNGDPNGLAEALRTLEAAITGAQRSVPTTHDSGP